MMMKITTLTLLSVFLFLQVLAQDDVKEAFNLVERIAPDYVKNIQFKKDDKAGKEYFRIEDNKSGVLITANNANSMAVGLNYYLKNYCLVNISWNVDDKIVLPAVQPKVGNPIERESRVSNRFFLNYCTFGYTMPWWHWREWEHFIDWMALNGVNMPLAITGQEKVWLNVWQKFGLSEKEILAYFTGPSYLPWHRMANIDSWGGPLPISWVEGQADLQQKILERERAFNMKPILPAFAGHVPKLLGEKFPDSKVNSLGEWGEFSEQYQSYFLDSFDPLFRKIQHEYIKEQTRLFGTNHIYGIDPFNEVTPPSWEPEYLASVSKNIYEHLAEVDPEAIWLQMTWLFYHDRKHWSDERIKAYLTGAPEGKMMLLDYFGEKIEVWKMTEAFYGQPYIWCYLGNFGGTHSIVGNVAAVDERIENVIEKGGRNFVGLGATLEGFGVNQVLYEFLLEKAWTNVSYQDFSESYANARYGKVDVHAQKAWSNLMDNVYLKTSDLFRGDLTNTTPSFDKATLWTWRSFDNYDNKALIPVWEDLLKVESTSDHYNYDLVVVTKQALGNYFKVLRDDFASAYKAKDLVKMQANYDKSAQLFKDLDEVLATNQHFLVGKWINDARTWGVDEKEADYFETDARRIISTWGENGRFLSDYANRSYAGMMSSYYWPKWKLFFEEAIASVKNNTDFNQQQIQKQINDMNWNWSAAFNKYSNVPVGDSKTISIKLLERYRNDILNR